MTGSIFVIRISSFGFRHSDFVIRRPFILAIRAVRRVACPTKALRVAIRARPNQDGNAVPVLSKGKNARSIRSVPNRIVLMLACSMMTTIPRVTTSQEPATPAVSLSVLAPNTVSGPFVELATAAAQSIPEPIWQLVQRAGWQVRLAEFVIDVQPALVADQPRGWPATSSWQEADAIHFPAQRLLVIAEKRRDRRGQIVAASRVGGVLRHELGHAFDMAIGNQDRFRSASAEFLLAYHADVKQLPSEAGREMAYYLQPSEAGRQEAFAEAFGIALGGGSDVTKESAFRQTFPHVLAFVQRELDRTAGHQGHRLLSDTGASPVEPSRSEWSERSGRAARGWRARWQRGA
jgi:hypothetical protein